MVENVYDIVFYLILLFTKLAAIWFYWFLKPLFYIQYVHFYIVVFSSRCTQKYTLILLCCVYNSASWVCYRWAREMTWHVCWAGEDSVMMMLSCCRYWRNWRELQPRCWTGERQRKRRRMIEWVDEWLSSNSCLCSWMCVTDGVWWRMKCPPNRLQPF